MRGRAFGKLGVAGLLAALLWGIAGCRPGAAPEAASRGADAPQAIILQTDWFPQAEHGGFYQALARGFYAEVGLAVTIRPGGPNAMTMHQVIQGRAQFALNRADTLLRARAEGMPLKFVMATLRHDAQGILVHADSPVQTLADLDGRRVKAIPGLAWIDMLEARYQIEVDVVVHDFGLERFLVDPTLAQQCLMTNEPFFVAEAGVEARVLPLSAAGFDPPHGVYGRSDWIADNPETVRAFLAASIRGWQDFLLGDPAPAFALIAAENPRMTLDFLAWSHAQLRAGRHILGREPEAADGSRVGQFDPAAWQALAEEMRAAGVLEQMPAVGELADPSFLPAPQSNTTVLRP